MYRKVEENFLMSKKRQIGTRRVEIKLTSLVEMIMISILGALNCDEAVVDLFGINFGGAACRQTTSDTGLTGIDYPDFSVRSAFYFFTA